MEKDSALLLLGSPEDEGGDDVELAIKAFFKAGSSGSYKKAAKAFREAVRLCDHEDEDDDESSDDEDDDELML